MPVPRRIPPELRDTLSVLFIARHARWEGEGGHPQDGTHAVYHREIRTALESLPIRLEIADDYRVLFEPARCDFVFPLLNRGGFLNSEMLLPLLCERQGLPYLGASPILRGLADDKHLAKRAAQAAGIPTAPWAVYRRGAAVDAALCPRAPRYVIKPNASSASWGVSDAWDWAGVRAAVQRLHDEGHDALVEPFILGHDIEVSVITRDGEPLILPSHIVEQDDPAALRTYAEKRDLTAGQAYAIRPLEDLAQAAVAEARARRLFREYAPFDYGRFEFRLHARTGEILFLEVNLNCNLWSRKTIALAAARLGWSHADLIETILTESLDRHGLLARRYHAAA